MTSRRTRYRRRLAGAVASIAGLSGGGVVAASAVADTTLDVQAAKVAWAHFVADNFATPTSIAEPCPLLDPVGLSSAVAASGLVPSDRPVAVTLVREPVGAGIINVRCGVDFTAAASPAGSVAYAVEATMLDGQAVFTQYVNRVADNDTPLERDATFDAEVIVHCDGSACLAASNIDGLVITVRLRGSLADVDGAAAARELIGQLAPTIVAYLAGTPADG